MVSTTQMIGQSPAQAAESPAPSPTSQPAADSTAVEHVEKPRPDPTRYGDWEKNGRCIDF